MWIGQAWWAQFEVAGLLDASLIDLTMAACEQHAYEQYQDADAFGLPTICCPNVGLWKILCMPMFVRTNVALIAPECLTTVCMICDNLFDGDACLYFFAFFVRANVALSGMGTPSSPICSLRSLFSLSRFGLWLGPSDPCLFDRCPLHFA